MSGKVPSNKSEELQNLLQKLFFKIQTNYEIVYKGKETISFTDATSNIINIAEQNFIKIKDQKGTSDKYIVSIKKDCNVNNPHNEELIDFSFTEGNLRSIYKANKKIGSKRTIGKKTANTFALYLGYQGWDGFLGSIKIDEDIKETLEQNDNSPQPHILSHNRIQENPSPERRYGAKKNEDKEKKLNIILKSTLWFIGICFVSGIIFFGFRYFSQIDQEILDNKNVILVLPFNGDRNGNLQRYLVGLLNEKLEDSLNINVRSFDEGIDEGKEDYHKKAIEIGRSQHADIIIGGSFSTLNNVDYINPRITVITGPKAEYYINQEDFIPNFKIEQISLEKELVTKPVLLIRLIVGINHYLKGEYLEALKHIELVNNTSDVDNILINEINTLIGVCYFKLYQKDQNISYYVKADFYYSKAVDEDPESSLALSNLGILYLYEGLYDTAEQCFNKSVLLDSTNASALMGRTLVNYHHGRTNNLENDFKNVILLDSKNANNLINFGVYWQSIDSFDNAIFYFQKALSTNPSLLRPKYLLAKSYLSIGDITNSEKYCDIVFDSYPDKDYIWHEIAQVYYSLNNIDKGISCLKKAHEIEPNNLEHTYSIAHLYFNINRIDSAIYYCNKSIDIDSMSSKSWNLLATIYMKVPNYWEAKQCYLNSIKNEKLNNFNNWFGLGNVYSSLSDYDSAVYSYNKAIEIDSTIVGVWISLGKSLCDLTEYEKALDCYNYALLIDSSNIYALNGNGYVSNILGKNEEALSFYKKSLKLNPNSPNVAYEIGSILYKQGKYEQSIVYIKQVIELDPFNPAGYSDLGALYLKLGDYDNASINIHKALDINPGLETAKHNLKSLNNLNGAK